MMQRSGSKKAYALIALLIMLCSPLYSRCQELITTDSNRIRNAKMVILSEWHLLDILPAYKRKLIEKLYKEEGLTDLVLETGKATAYLLNEYVASGDTSIMSSFPLFTQSDKDYWKNFGKYKLSSGKPVKIHGVDFERITMVPALRRVLVKTGHTKNELYQYLSSLPDTLINLSKYDKMIAERSAVIQKCISIYRSDVPYYSAIYDNGYIVKDICENTALETAWDKRWDAMAHNLRLLYNKKAHKYLLIVGMFHVDCPNPIFKELEQAYQLEESDIVNITMVVKDCDVEAMYKGRGRIKLSSSKKILAEAGLTDMLYRFHVQPCVYQLVDVRSRLPSFKPDFKCDYILPVDCGYDHAACN